MSVNQVVITNPKAGQALCYDATDGLWENAQPAIAAGTTAVATGANMIGNGLTATPVAFNGIVHDLTMVGDGVVGSGYPLSWTGAQTDTTLTGNGIPGGTPLSWAGAQVDGTTITGNGLLGTPLSAVPTSFTTTQDLSIQGTQSIPNGAATVFTGSTLVSTFQATSNATTWITGLGQFKPSVAGMFALTQNVQWPNSATGYRQSYITYIDTANPSPGLIIDNDFEPSPTATQLGTTHNAVHVRLDTTDVVEFWCMHTTGTATLATYTISCVYLHP